MKIKDILIEIQELREENQRLHVENDFLERKCSKLTKENKGLLNENLKRIEESDRLWGELFDIKHMSVWEFANKYCNDNELEEAGHSLARSLLGVGK